MKRIIFLFLILIFLTFKSLAQNADIWTAFYDDEDYLFGYKNSKGEIMIPAKYMGFSVAKKFDKIVALMEENNGTYESYYLLKNGMKFGKDSLYVFDMTFDCESEGFIKFRDKKTDKVGMFDEYGKIAIPAEYNDMTQFRKGLAVGIKNAKKKYWHKRNNHSDCNHWSWVDGKTVLINKKNEVLVEDFPLDKSIDYYSLKISVKPIEDSSYINFLGVDGKYYSFIDNEKQFDVFLKENFLNNIDVKNLIDNSYQDFIYWKDGIGWTSKPNEKFFQQNLPILAERLAVIKNKDTDYSINTESFFPIPKDLYSQFEEFYDNCGNWNISKFPIFNIIVTHKDENKNFLFQDHFTFVRIGNKIQFISCTIRNGKLE